MNYTILIYETPANFAERNDPDAKKREAYWAEWPIYTKALQDAGVMRGGAVLQPSDTATLLKFKDGKQQVQDGPFADTKEQLGGFYIIDVPDLDTALAWTARCPRWPGRVYEVRPNLVAPG